MMGLSQRKKQFLPCRMSRSGIYLVLAGIAAAVLAGLGVAYIDGGSLVPPRIPTLELLGAVVVLVGVVTTAVLLVGRYLPFVIWSPIYGSSLEGCGFGFPTASRAPIVR
jgi:hypothetical protein